MRRRVHVLNGRYIPSDLQQSQCLDQHWFTCVHVYCCVDVVRAYKGLLKEKEALEASLKALSVQQPEGEKRDGDEFQGDEGADQEGELDKDREGESGQSHAKQVSDKVCTTMNVRWRERMWLKHTARPHKVH